MRVQYLVLYNDRKEYWEDGEDLGKKVPLLVSDYNTANAEKMKNRREKKLKRKQIKG